MHIIYVKYNFNISKHDFTNITTSLLGECKKTLFNAMPAGE